MNKGAKTKGAYEELGFPDAGEMLVKAQLVVKIAKILRSASGASRRLRRCLA